MKIIDAIRESITNNRQFFGVEFFPPHMEAGRLKLYDCMERLFHQTEPLFCGITWGDGGSTSRETIEIADAAQRLAPILMQVHLTGSGCTEQQVLQWLQDIKRRDLKNVFLLRGVRLPSFARLTSNSAASLLKNNNNGGGGNSTPSLVKSAEANNNAAAGASFGTSNVAKEESNSDNNNNSGKKLLLVAGGGTPPTSSHNISALLKSCANSSNNIQSCINNNTQEDSSNKSTSPPTSTSSTSLLPHKNWPTTKQSPSSSTTTDTPAAGTSFLSAFPAIPENSPTLAVSPNSLVQDNQQRKRFSNSNNNINDVASPAIVVPSTPFDYASDLVRFVRKHFGSYFGITVAGYPEGHHEGEDRATSIKHLKEKIDAGADLVICQFVFDAKTFLQFCEDCRNAGITCPIIPSIVAIHSVTHLKRMANLRRHAGMDVLEEKLKQVSSTNDDEAVRDVVVDFTANLVKQLFRSGVRGVYFMTQNVDVVTRKIIARVAELRSGASGIMDYSIISNNHNNNINGGDNNANNNNGMKNFPSSNSLGSHADLTSPSCINDRPLPWKASLRHSERARPIYWSSRPASYLAALDGISRYDDHPNDRWSNASSPAFGEQYQHVKDLINATAKLCPAFLQVKSLHDVSQAFVDFLSGKGSLPWSAGDGLAAESDALLMHVLLPMNKRGLLTINSQPAVNGAPSEDKTYGWGPRGGFVYQKQYLEFFCSPAALDTVISIFESFPSVVYMAQRRDKSGRRTNMPNPQGGRWVEQGSARGDEKKKPKTQSSQEQTQQQSIPVRENDERQQQHQQQSSSSTLLLRKSQKERNRILTGNRNLRQQQQQDHISLSAIFAGTGGIIRKTTTTTTVTTNDVNIAPAVEKEGNANDSLTSSDLRSNNNNDEERNESTNSQQQQQQQLMSANPKLPAHHLHAAVTWGVFPSQDVVQPTFVSSSAFDVWTPEAFTMWLYPFHGHSSAEQIPQVIQDIVEGWYLVTALDNDYNNSSVVDINNENNNATTQAGDESSTSGNNNASENNNGIAASIIAELRKNNVVHKHGNFATPLNQSVARICSILPEI